jgi:hypothetical protein
MTLTNLLMHYVRRLSYKFQMILTNVLQSAKQTIPMLLIVLSTSTQLTVERTEYRLVKPGIRFLAKNYEIWLIHNAHRDMTVNCLKLIQPSICLITNRCML